MLKIIKKDMKFYKSLDNKFNAAYLALDVSKTISRYYELIESSLKELGFTRIKWNKSTSFFGICGSGTKKSPVHLKARKDGKWVYILFSEIFYNLKAIPLSNEICDYIEENHGKDDVYYCPLTFFKREDDLQLCMRMPVLVYHGQWNDELESLQFLPANKLKRFSPFMAIVGPGFLDVASLIYSLYEDKAMKIDNCYIRNLCTKEDMLVDGYEVKLLNIKERVIMLTNNGGDEIVESYRYADDDPTLELEFVGFEYSDDKPVLASWMDKTGCIFYASCVEIAYFRNRLKSGQRFRGTLSMGCLRCWEGPKDFELTDGLLFEHAKENYKQENGSMPPDDFAVKISTGGMRSIIQDDEGSKSDFAGIIGQVCEVSYEDTIATKLVRLKVQCMVDNDDFYVHVFVPVNYLDTYEPKVKDTVFCEGFLTYAPEEYVETDQAWLDSPQIGERMENKENSLNVASVFAMYMDFSIALAVVASELTSKGWSIIQDYTKTPAWYKPSLVVMEQDGSIHAVCIDQVIDGKEPKRYYKQRFLDGIARRAKEAHGNDVLIHYVRVALDSSDDGSYYKVSIIDDDGLALDNRIQTVRAARKVDIPVALHDNESLINRENSRNSDEEKIAEIVAKALHMGDWETLSMWMREDTTYRSYSAGVDFDDKISLLRHLCARRDEWSESGLLNHIGYDYGTLLVDGHRRTCLMSFVHGVLWIAWFFEIRDGLISAIYVPDKSHYYTYISHSLEKTDAAMLSMPAEELKGAWEGATPDFVQEVVAHSLVVEHLKKLMADYSDDNANDYQFTWIKDKREFMSFCNVIFEYKGNQFAVFIQKGEVFEAEDGKKGLKFLKNSSLQAQGFLSLCRENNMIPCTIVVDKYGYPIVKGWGLIHMETNEKINPLDLEEVECDMSIAELHAFAVNVVCKYITEKEGGVVFSSNVTFGVNPQIWFKTKDNQRAYVVVRASTCNMPTPKQPQFPDVEKVQLELYQGFWAEVGLACAEDFGPPKRGKGCFVKFKGLEKFTP